MMRTKLWNYLALALLMCLAACTEKSEYAWVIPQDASAVASANLTNLTVKSGLTQEKNQAALAHLRKSLTQGLPAEQAKMLDGILTNPQESGIDFTQPVYTFQMPDKTTWGLVACVKESDKLHDLVDVLAGQQLCAQLTEQDGASWTETESMVLAFTDNKALVASASKGADMAALKQQAKGWLEAGKERSFAQTEQFRQMKEAKGDIACTLTMDLLPPDLRSLIQSGLPPETKMSDMSVLTVSRFEKGKMVTDMHLVCTNKELKKLAEERIAAFGKLNNKFMNFYPEHTFCWMALRTDGEKLYDLLEKQQTLAGISKLTKSVDLKTALSSINGVVTLGAGITEDDIPQFALFAEVKNTGFLQEMVNQLKPLVALSSKYVRLVPTGKDRYELQLANGSMFGMGEGPTAVCLGVRDGYFYLTNDKLSLDEGVQGKTLAKSAWNSQVDGKRFFFSMDMVGGRDLINKSIPPKNRDAAQLVLNTLSYLTFELKDAETVSMTLASTDPETNMLEQWTDLALKLGALGQ